MKRVRFAGDTCPIARSLDEIGDWWTLLIVRNALAGTRRFSEFQQQLGISKNILTARLEKLVEAGVFEMRPDPAGSRHREYHLTDKGMRLRMILLALRQWGEDELFDHGEEMTILADRRDGKPLGKLQIRSHDGRALEEADTLLTVGKKAAMADTRTG
jgi:DNA-binding HxlR family transcriptional regulator